MNQKNEQDQGPRLDYAPPLRKRGHSAWSAVGLAIALVYAIPPFMMWRDIARIKMYGGRMILISAGVTYYSMYALVPVALCLVGAWRGRRLLSVVGIAVALIAMIGVIAAVKGSPWR